ncbi:DUF2000 domain-containing protein [Leptolinea tardivitalis]|uniref:DUF2000 domain-containing protein n=1 Tax=Leptolinea tardivitalis TaxID=229920 RepID=A0A0P6X9M0_9CHLR|nr:DUF2000 domain-containing protein [Leptolinea tardivitalis]KPL71168.1 hypothetical protein ADM99_13025 [Leptolinea tardivitalis]
MMKCVMVIDQNLPLGLIANTAAVLAISLGKKVDGIVGEDVVDRDGTVHKGITRATVPLLKGDSSLIRSLRSRLLSMPENSLFFVDFCDIAQQSKRYEDYTANIALTSECDLTYLGIAIYGEDREVNKLTGNIGLLR